MSFAGIYEGGVGVLLGRNALVLMVVDSAGVSGNSEYRLFDRSSSKPGITSFPNSPELHQVDVAPALGILAHDLVS